MKRIKRILVLLSVVCAMMSSISVYAADERLGTVVDGSLLTDKTEVELHEAPRARGTYLASGSGSLSLKDTRYVNAFGCTSCYRISDQVKVTLYLQRLTSNNNWSTICRLGPKTAYNTSYVSNSQNYRLVGGSYYRIYGTHTAINDDKFESVASYTDGMWVD